jgi:hypothetical protein
MMGCDCAYSWLVRRPVKAQMLFRDRLNSIRQGNDAIVQGPLFVKCNRELKPIREGKANRGHPKWLNYKCAEMTIVQENELRFARAKRRDLRLDAIPLRCETSLPGCNRSRDASGTGYADPAAVSRALGHSDMPTDAAVDCIGCDCDVAGLHGCRICPRAVARLCDAGSALL